MASLLLLDNLLTWNNLLPYQGTAHLLGCRRSIQKIVISEIAASVILVTSTIESVAYAAIALLFLSISSIDTKFSTMFIGYALASGASGIGSLFFVIINPLIPLIGCIHRCLTTRLPHRTAPVAPQFEVAEPFQYIPIRHQEDDNQLHPASPRDQGSLLITKMLQNVDPIITKAFEDQDSSIYLFLVRKAVYFYTLGPNKQAPIPAFFYPEVIEGIGHLRSKYETASPNNQSRALLEALIHDNAQFDIDSPSFSTALSHDQNTNDVTSVKTLFQELCDVSDKELQGGLFVTQCCQDAYNKAYLQR